jgi:hypothetical protein
MLVTVEPPRLEFDARSRLASAASISAETIGLSLLVR